MALTAVACRNAKPEAKPVKLTDGGGLYLLVNGSGKYWRWDYRHAGKRKTMALGVFPETTLAQARATHIRVRALLARGDDPMAVRQADKRRGLCEAANSFKLLALEWHQVKSVSWQAGTAHKTLRHLETHLFPDLGHRPVTQITPPELLQTLRKIKARYTATRLREVCGQIFRYGIAVGKAVNNPAGDLLGALAVPRTTHRPALTDRREFGEFLRELRAYTAADALTLLATRLAMLTFVRSQELRLARWGEVDCVNREWRIPAGRMKMAKGSNQAHVVPLSAQSLEALAELRRYTGANPLLFPNNYGADRVMSENTIGRMLWRMGYKGRQTLHGFRASARSLLSERGWSVEALERQLDHSERSKVVAAYARSEHLEERRRIMDDWGSLVAAMEAGDNVVAITRAA
ncbi:MAG: integrase arm-type DNA-binding domain-containing protein [Burkholderiales bacterium]|nr:integrase arm-type DNA-binding domain-containing protein [Burkholderiales bacterium]